MNFLFVHRNFPGQYKHLAPALVAAGHRCEAIAASSAPGLASIPIHRYRLKSSSGNHDTHPWARDFNVKCLRAEAVAIQAFNLAADGFKPDLIIGHPGWGELLAIKDVFPSTPVLHQLEFIYQLEGADTYFDPEIQVANWQSSTKLRLRRATQLLAMHDLDHAIAATQWQASTATIEFRDRITVIHEGIDTVGVQPNPAASIQLKAAGLNFRPGDELISFVSRQLEPYRGFHIFMRMLTKLQILRPDCHAVIVGGNGVSYGLPPSSGGTWRQTLLEELKGTLDLSRIHFVGQVPHDILHNLFQVTACHVYLTYPFVLSWSMLEAMSCGALIVGSATPPVEEVIQNGANGLLVDFFDHNALAEQIANVLADRSAYADLALAGRSTIKDRYDLKSISLPKQLGLIYTLAMSH